MSDRTGPRDLVSELRVTMPYLFEPAPCVASVEPRGGRYPFVPVCSCGWETRGYLTAEAAQILADDHVAPVKCPPIRYGATS